jgi:cation transporter-like permease
MLRINFFWMRVTLIALLWVGLAVAAANAHGGIAGPDELGPPVITSALIGIACYWIVVLWPSGRRRVTKLKPKRQ